MVTDARRVALRILAEVRRGRRLDVAFAAAASRLPGRDRAWVHEAVYGVCRLRGRLDHLVGQRVHRGMERLDPAVRDALRLGAYQVLYMGSVPRYAAVSETVSQAREVAGKGAAGLVNAVLRGVADHGDGPERFPEPGDAPAAYLSTWGSHPRWMVDRWLQRWTPEEVSSLVTANNRPPSLHLVPLDRPPEEAVAALQAEGIGAEPVGQGTDCVRVLPGTDPRAALAVLPSIIQDPGANLVVQYADATRGMKVADLCAAPGGKALALSAKASFVLAADRSEARMHMLRENVKRTGTAVGAVVADASRPPVAAADMVLLDVPCTGTGTLGRHPDGRWRLRAGSVAKMADVQRELLEAAATVVRPGGVLVYATCSLEPEENEIQVEGFLRRHGEFVLEPSPALAVDVTERLDEAGRLVVLPHESGFDGAFAARLRRCA